MIEDDGNPSSGCNRTPASGKTRKGWGSAKAVGMRLWGIICCGFARIQSINELIPRCSEFWPRRLNFQQIEQARLMSYATSQGEKKKQ